MARQRLWRQGTAVTAVTVALGAVTRVGHLDTAAVAWAVSALVVCAMIAATVKIVQFLFQPEVQRERTFRLALRQAKSPEEKERVLLCMTADKTAAVDRPSVMQILKQRLGQPLSGGEKGVVRPASTDGVTQMPGKGKPAA